MKYLNILFIFILSFIYAIEGINFDNQIVNIKYTEKTIELNSDISNGYDIKSNFNRDDDEDEDDDDEDDENYEARALFGGNENDESTYYGKVKVKIADNNVNKMEFELENLSFNQFYYIRFNDSIIYNFSTDDEGNFEFNLASDDSEDGNLPLELMPVSELIIAELFTSDNFIIETAYFTPDDAACADLLIDLCNAIPMCFWDDIVGCSDSNWDFDEDDDGIPDDEDDDDDNDGIPDDEDEDDWDEGEYFSTSLYDIYEEYISDYNIDGNGFFNFIIINFDRSSRSDIGDNIGLFDTAGQLNGIGCEPTYGDILVGSGTLQGNVGTLFAFGTHDNCGAGGSLYPGFIEGNQINLEFWNSIDSTLTVVPVDAVYGPSQSIIEITVTLPTVDLNNDFDFNVADILIMVNIILDIDPINMDADLNLDGVINVADIIIAIELILGN
ncbi:MAG: hypothetical protein H8E60_00455 [Candidatus Marinimicrobia bacterium]|nr:hypothetical protein [Candidatus Neomarinimicrobiota bacterium]